MTSFYATALTLYDERTFRQGFYLIGPMWNLFFYFLFSNHKMKFILAKIFSQNGAIVFDTDIPLFPCVCVCVPGEKSRGLCLSPTIAKKTLLLPHSKISSKICYYWSAVSFKFYYPCRWNWKDLWLFLMNSNWTLRQLIHMTYFNFLRFLCVRSIVIILLKNAIHH